MTYPATPLGMDRCGARARRPNGARPLRVERLEDRRLLAGDFELLVNAADLPERGGSNPNELTAVGDVAYFTASTPTLGTELWKTDGSEDGTVLVKDIRGGRDSSAPSLLTNINGTLYFVADDGVFGPELWKVDSAAGAVRLSDTPSGVFGGFNEIVAAGGSVYFTAPTSSLQMGLWKTDGTPEGTSLVRALGLFTTPSSPPVSNLTEMNGLLYFFANDSVHGMELWKSDGTADGTVLVKDLVSGYPSGIPTQFGDPPPELINFNGTLYFAASDSNAPPNVELWKSDGTAAGTTIVKDIAPRYPGSSPQRLFVFGESLYFVANDGNTGFEVWKTDGTADGTTLLKDIRPGFSDGIRSTLNTANDPQFTIHDGQLYFLAGNSAPGALWRTDGTTAGTVEAVALPYINPTFTGHQLTSILDRLYFVTDAYDVYSSDGTAAGTVRLRDFTRPIVTLPPFGESARPGKYFVQLGEKVIFPGATAELGSEPWSTDGTPAGTTLVADIHSGDSGSGPGNRVEYRGSLYFTAGGRLWRTDGTPGGTFDATPALPEHSPTGLASLTLLDDVLYFTAETDLAGRELWRSDGTAAGTWMIKDVFPGSDGSWPSDLVKVDGTLYFIADDGVAGYNVWRSDGTPEGTVRLEGLVPDDNERAGFLQAVGGTAVFVADDGTGDELWRVVGDRVEKLRDFTGDDLSGSPSRFTAAGGVLYFTANDRSGGINVELWRTDGTPEGTVLVKEVRTAGSASPANLIHVDGLLYFTAADDDYAQALWRTDGTAEGTVRVAGIRVAGSGVVSSPQSIRLVGGVLYFVASDGVHGQEIWRSDGTAEGTYQLADLAPGAATAFPANLTDGYGTLYFTAYSEASGEELWRSDGTAEGTMLAKDLVPGSGSSAPSNITPYGGGLVATVITPEYGQEVWAMLPDSTGDYNADGATDGADLLAWQRSFGQAATPPGSGADGNGNGRVDAADLAVWRNRFGAVASGAAVGSAAGVAMPGVNQGPAVDAGRSSEGRLGVEEHHLDAALAELAGTLSEGLRTDWRGGASLRSALPVDPAIRTGAVDADMPAARGHAVGRGLAPARRTAVASGADAGPLRSTSGGERAAWLDAAVDSLGPAIRPRCRLTRGPRSLSDG